MRIKLTKNQNAFFIGDVHGGFDELMASLKKNNVKDDDVIFFLGDLINKRKKSFEVLKYAKSRPNTYIVKGNHEHFFIEYFFKNQTYFKDQIFSNGGQWCLEADSNLMYEYAEWLNDVSQLYIEVEYEDKVLGLVHADVPKDDWDYMKGDIISNWRDMIFSFRKLNEYVNDGIANPIKGIDGVILGHKPVEKVTKVANVLFIDTGSFYKDNANYYNEGEITCLNINEAYNLLF